MEWSETVCNLSDLVLFLFGCMGLCVLTSVFLFFLLFVPSYGGNPSYIADDGSVVECGYAPIVEIIADHADWNAP
eukprot:SAG31_NODE_26122_length_448_cov_0.647564_2_plen_74_part_01